MEVVFREEVERVRFQGAAVLLSSHILSEVEQLCDRVSIIRAGRIVDSGTLAELRHLTSTEISFVEPPGGQALDVPGAVDLEVSGGRVRFTAPSDGVSALLPELARLGVTGLRIEPPTLETLFLHHYGDDLASGSPGVDPATRAGRRHARNAAGGA